MIGKIISTAIEHGALWFIGAALSGAASVKFVVAALLN